MKGPAKFILFVAAGALLAVWAMNNVSAVGSFVGPKSQK